MFSMTLSGNGKLYIHIISQDDAIVNIESPYTNFSKMIQTKANKPVVVPIPSEFLLTKYGIESKGILVKSNVDISVTGISQEQSIRGEAYSAIPTRFLSHSYTSAVFGDAIVSVVALHNDTLVNVTYRSRTTPGREKHVESSFGITLSRLQTFQTFGPIGGTTLSSNKPIGVISGSSCFDHHYGINETYCNQLLSYIPPTRTFGQCFIIPQITKGQFSLIHIESSFYLESNLSVQGALFNKTTQFTGSDQYSLLSKLPYFVYTSIPSVVTLYTSRRFSTSPPSMLIIPAISQYSNNYNFLTPSTQYFDHQAIIIIKTKEVAGLIFDGQYVSSIPSDSESIKAYEVSYDVIAINITAGVHEVYHPDVDVTFGLLSLGFNQNQAYAFPVGLSLRDGTCD
ncbi:hypothetical protein FSP39_010174 [Pinctada imbricata]|uniref:IgGFc-binding protein N-terminal domain-containing protein n=1 Tax=Pinctada imbricata TaxID=66713 RepID=A0AA89BSV6_PINIB|nr:hypothetical protein FSP39_010174 [Pinctada imbricata]